MLRTLSKRARYLLFSAAGISAVILLWPPSIYFANTWLNKWVHDKLPFCVVACWIVAGMIFTLVRSSSNFVKNVLWLTIVPTGLCVAGLTLLSLADVGINQDLLRYRIGTSAGYDYYVETYYRGSPGSFEPLFYYREKPVLIALRYRESVSGAEIEQLGWNTSKIVREYERWYLEERKKQYDRNK